MVFDLRKSINMIKTLQGLNKVLSFTIACQAIGLYSREN